MSLPPKILIYDDNCPLCNWYSSLFIKYRLLPAEGRQAFSTLDPAILQLIDFNKSRNEIPLADTRTGEVLYGIDALLEILGNKYPFIRKAGKLQPVNFLLRKLYKLVSYNRKVIVAKKCSAGAIDCAPDTNYPYRYLFITLSYLFITLMLFPLHALVLQAQPAIRLSLVELQWAHLGFTAVNCLLVFRMKKNVFTEYIGQVNMLALLTILLLLPLLLLTGWLPLASWLNLVYLSLVSIIVFREYIRRMEYTGLLHTDSWIAGTNLACMAAFLILLFRL